MFLRIVVYWKEVECYVCLQSCFLVWPTCSYSGSVTDGLSVLCLESTLLESPWYVKAKLTYSEVRSDR